MQNALHMPSRQEVLRLLQTHLASARLHMQADLFPRIAKAVGNQQLTPTQMADAILREINEYSNSFAPCLRSQTEILAPRIVAALVPDRVTARQIQLLLNPAAVYA